VLADVGRIVYSDTGASANTCDETAPHDTLRGVTSNRAVLEAWRTLPKSTGHPERLTRHLGCAKAMTAV
jgi:hypothetical protein